MTPGLTRQGACLIVAAILFLAVGVATMQWVILAMGTLVATGLCLEYLAFLFVAALFRRQRIEFAWWVAPSETAGGALVVGQPFSLMLFVRNRSAIRIDGTRLTLLHSSALKVAPDRSLRPGVA